MKKGCIITNSINFDEKRTLLKRNSSNITMIKDVTMGNIIHIRQLVWVIPGYQQLSDYGSKNTKTNLTNSGTDTDIYIIIMDINMNVVYGAISLENKFSMDDEYYNHEGGR